MSLYETILRRVNPYVRMPTIGLDISDRSVKYLKFNIGKSVFLDFWGEIEIPEGVIINGEIKNEDLFVEILGALTKEKEKSFHSSFFAVSLPEEKSFLRVIQLPRIKGSDVGNAIPWELEGNIPLPVEDLVYDYEVVEPPEGSFDHLDIVVTAFPKAIVASYLRVLKRAEIRPVALELESQAIMRSLSSHAKDRSTTIVIDIGKTRSSFIVFAGGAILFTETIPVGGIIFEKEIAKALKVPAEKATTIKKEVGLNKKELEGKVYAALLPAISIIANELKKTIAYYQSHERAQHIHGVNQTIDTIFLAGGDANLFGLDTYLASITKILTQRADPFSIIKNRMRAAVPQIAKNQALAFTTVIGLALRDIPSKEF